MSTFTILAEPARRDILDAIRTNPQTVGALVDTVGMSQPVVSKHLRILKDAGLVTVRPDGQRRWYQINPEPLNELDEWLEPYRQFWSQKLDALEGHLDATFPKGENS